MSELKNYTNPITKKEHIKELQEVLIQATIDYINKYNLRDIDEVNINMNGLTGSALEGKWLPCTDSYIEVIGLERGDKYLERRIIGDYC